ncbi:hypothetical protein BGX29_003789 [Mortierella sp. GBA35]|nr:hypothetical protein BGX29_003789 [Mortierella sp. GBA35]
MPWLLVLGMTMGLSDNSVEQLRIKVICTHLLGPQAPHDGSDGFVPGNFSSIVEAGARTLVPDDPCKSEMVLGFVGLLQGHLGTVLGICTLLTLAKWTSLSDVLGRKFLLHVTMFGVSLSFLLNWFAASRFNFLGYKIYYVESVFLGLVPARSLANPAVIAYSADCTPKNQRSLMIGYLIASMSLGNIIGPALGGYIYRATGDLTVVVKISLVSVALLALYLSILPESLKRKPVSLAQLIAGKTGRDGLEETLLGPAKEETSVAWTFKRVYYLIKANLSTIFDPLLVVVPGRILKSENMATSYTPVLILLVSFFSLIGSAGPAGLFVPMTNYIFHWDAYEDGLYSTFVAICGVMTFLAIFPALQLFYKKYVFSPKQPNNESTRPLILEADESQGSFAPMSSESGPSGINAIKMDLVFAVCGYILLVISHLIVPLIPTVPTLYFASALKSLAQIASVSNVSLLSSVMPAELTGTAVGAMSVTDSIGQIVSDLFYGYLFNRTLKTSPMFYYYVSVGLCALALFLETINWWSYRRRK